MDAASRHPAFTWAERKLLTFFSTDEETSGKERDGSLSPASAGKRGGQINCGGGARSSVLAFEHLLDEGAALGDILIDDELRVIGGDEEDHYWSSSWWG